MYLPFTLCNIHKKLLIFALKTEQVNIFETIFIELNFKIWSYISLSFKE